VVLLSSPWCETKNKFFFHTRQSIYPTTNGLGRGEKPSGSPDALRDKGQIESFLGPKKPCVARGPSVVSAEDREIQWKMEARQGGPRGKDPHHLAMGRVSQAVQTSMRPR